MTFPLLVMLTGAAVLAIGLVAHLVVRDHTRRIVAINVASGGVMMVLLALADRGDTGADTTADPVPQALVLTGIVIMAAITGLALALARRIERTDDEEETADPDADEGGQGAPAVERTEGDDRRDAAA